MIFNYSYEDTNGESKKIHWKIILIVSIVLIVVGLSIAGVYFYKTNDDFRNILDQYVFRKEVLGEDLVSITLNSENNQTITAFGRNVVIIEKGSIIGYNSAARETFSISANINNPITTSGSNFLVVAESNGQKICYISSGNISWEKELEGEILSIHSNKNGYVSVILTDTSYRSIIITYDNKGTELFKTVLAKTYAVDCDISNDNKYLAIAELNSKGSTISSSVKIISIEKAKKNEEDPFIYIYNNEGEDLLISVNFQDKNRLICMYDTRIDVIADNKREEFITISSKDTLFADINLENTVLIAKRISTGVFSAETEITLINTTNKKENKYIINGTPKKIVTYNNLIGVDLGQEIHFINTSGWLIKRYTGSGESNNIVFGNNISGIIYRNKIELLNF